MKLRTLEAYFVRVLSVGPAGNVTSFRRHETMFESDGLWFLCPKCFGKNNGPIGTHAILCWFVGHVADAADPKPGRWEPKGSGLDDITFVGPRAASVLLTSGCKWHGFIRNGEAVT